MNIKHIIQSQIFIKKFLLQKNSDIQKKTKRREFNF